MEKKKGPRYQPTDQNGGARYTQQSRKNEKDEHPMKTEVYIFMIQKEGMVCRPQRTAMTWVLVNEALREEA